jgi:hypothetical protein
MARVNRRDMIRMGAAGGAALAGLAARGAGQASAASTNGVHIHGTLRVLTDTPGGPFASTTPTQEPGPEIPVDIPFMISIDAWGPDSDLSGQGWGELADLSDKTQPARVDITQRIYSQRGSIRGDVVTLKGRMLFSNIPGDEGGPIITEANLTTGHIRFTAGNSLSHAVLEGTGVVMRI